jgi:hypothetical protein
MVSALCASPVREPLIRGKWRPIVETLSRSGREKWRRSCSRFV